MSTEIHDNSKALFRLLPSVSSLLLTETSKEIETVAGCEHATTLAKKAVDILRMDLPDLSKTHSGELSKEVLAGLGENLIAGLWTREESSRLTSVINATGVVIHTNLGRAALSERTKAAIVEQGSFCSLEYDLNTGKRGKRGAYVEELLKELTGAEDALVVNNCAAAAVLILTALASGGEGIISRGELVEIGGDFRVPDVMTQSGAELVEVGTTNRTKLKDYEAAITDQTKVILRVHPSNYRVIGFTEIPTVGELSELARSRGIFLYEDAGSGALFDLAPYGLEGEPVIKESVADGADVISFSGDKLLGSVQAGLIVGKSNVIARIRKHPLFRALRPSKLTYAALEATLREFRSGNAMNEIPVLRMLSLSKDEVGRRAEKLALLIQEKIGDAAEVKLTDGESVLGGGAAPSFHPPTRLIAVRSNKLLTSEVESRLRVSNPPVITRTVDDSIVIDLRTVFENEEDSLLGVLVSVLADSPAPRDV